VRDLAALTAADFEAAVGSAFRVIDGPTGPLELLLTEVVRVNVRPGKGRPFSLLFQGPTSPVLEQVIHRLSNAEMGELDIFLGPVAADAGATTYEAVFT
jgi:hypothetical protein